MSNFINHYSRKHKHSKWFIVSQIAVPLATVAVGVGLFSKGIYSMKVNNDKLRQEVQIYSPEEQKIRAQTLFSNKTVKNPVMKDAETKKKGTSKIFGRYKKFHDSSSRRD